MHPFQRKVPQKYPKTNFSPVYFFTSLQMKTSRDQENKDSNFGFKNRFYLGNFSNTHSGHHSSCIRLAISSLQINYLEIITWLQL
jgi:hypothetical protein